MVLDNREACRLGFPDQIRSGEFSQNGRNWLIWRRHPARHRPFKGHMRKREPNSKSEQPPARSSTFSETEKILENAHERGLPEGLRRLMRRLAEAANTPAPVEPSTTPSEARLKAAIMLGWQMAHQEALWMLEQKVAQARSTESSKPAVPPFKPIRDWEGEALDEALKAFKPKPKS
jgi:hypothetical protein